MMQNKKLKGNIYLLLAGFLWGLSFIFQSKGIEVVPPIAFNGIRCLLGGVVLLPVIYIVDRNKAKNGIPVMKFDKTLITGGVLCGVFLCIATTLQTVGMLETSPGKAGFITALYMIIVPVINLLRGKKPTIMIFMAVAIAVAGLYFMCIPKGGFTLTTGDLLVFCCAFVFSGHILAIDHFSPKVDGIKLSAMQFFVCGIINIIWMFFDEVPTITNVMAAKIDIAYAGIVSCGVAYTLQIVGQKYTDPTSASILMSLESVFATLATVVLVALGWELTGGALSAREIFGCVLMFGAILLVQMPDKKQNEIV